MFQRTFIVAVAALSLLVAGCASTSTAPVAAPTAAITASSPTTAPPTVAPSTSSTTAASPTSAVTVVASPTSASAVTPSPPAAATAPPATTAASPVASASASDTVHYAIVPSGTEAQFKVREQLADRSFPSDAIGTTRAVTGRITVGADGKIVSDQSKFVVDMKTLKSDSDKRDGFIQRSTLNTAEYPTAEFVPTATTGLPSPLPASGKVSFQLTGNLTVHGVTHPVTWNVTGQVDGDQITGQATTSFKFEDFGMSPPHVFVVLSVQDNINLQMNFQLSRGA